MEKVSALMDGELIDGEAKALIAHLKQDDDLRYQWEAYHIVGDALRGEFTLSGDFNRQLFNCLALEPTILAPQGRLKTRALYTYAFSAAASVAGVALVAWVVISMGEIPALGPTAESLQNPDARATVALTSAGTLRESRLPATAPESAPAINAEPVRAAPLASVQLEEVSVPSDGQSNEYLLAHQGISPSTAIQGLAPYIRTVSHVSQVSASSR